MRTEDHVPVSAPPEPPADIEDKPAEPRTRDEYADQVATPSSPPIDDDPPEPEPERLSYPEDESRGSLSPPVLEAAQPDNDGIEPTDKSEARHQDAETKSRLNMDTESDDDLGHEPDDPHEPRGLPSDAQSTEETGQGESLEPGLTQSPEPNEEKQARGLPAPEGSGQDTSDIDERIRPLTDREWAEHLTEVRDGLAWARRHGLQTHRLYTIDSDKREWSAERNRLQGEIVSEMYEQAKDVPCDRQAIIAGGLGGAGKTTVLTEHADIDLSNYLVVNPDDIKEQMAQRGMIPEVSGLSPMEASDLSHEESSYIAKRLAMRAMTEGKNLIWDITMSSEDSTKERINNLRTWGYNRVEGLFVDISIDTSVRRIDARHREGHDRYRTGLGLGGRFVPEEVSRDQEDPEWGSHNRRTFERVKSSLDAWSIYDNSLDGQPPVRIESRPK